MRLCGSDLLNKNSPLLLLGKKSMESTCTRKYSRLVTGRDSVYGSHPLVTLACL